MYTIKNFAAIFCMITLMLLAGAGCESASRSLPIPVQEASKINDNIMGLVKNEIEEARDLGYLYSGSTYTDDASTVSITGSYVQTQSGNTTRATVQLLSLSFRVGTNTYYATPGTITYVYVLHPNGENTTTWSGNFTLTRELESWECRWPELKKELTLDPATEQLVSRQWQGSYVIDGVTYSYSRQ